jgi:pSer/pThr/pTyr-binding forkhead associated (FHA) protein
MSSGDTSAPPRRPATMLESIEEIRAQIRRPQTLKEAVDPPPTVQTEAPGDDTLPFRPTLRPSMALLTVLDDGDDSGELVRIRGESFVIGRVDGNLVIPHDGGMSGRHAEVLRRYEAGHYAWHLRDLQSTNGTFVRAAGGILKDRQELLIGGCRYRFDAAAPIPDPGPQGSTTSTRKWQSLSSADLVQSLHPTLVELTPEGEGRRFRLDQQENWAGRDPRKCPIVLNDPMVSPRHARIYRDDKGRWHIQNARSLNGLWIRIVEIPLDRGGQFQCGEQRFLIKIL